MNREDAYNRIDAIIAKHEIDDEYVTITSILDYDALRIARKALEQEPCDDAISREDALMCLTGEIKGTDTIETIIARSVRRIRKLPSVKPQEPCEDAISRQAVKELYYKDGYIDFRKICELPPVNPQPKTGHWMIDEDSTDRFFATYECSCCKRAIIVPHDVMKAVYKDYPFCHCGAKMVEPQERSEVTG